MPSVSAVVDTGRSPLLSDKSFKIYPKNVAQPLVGGHKALYYGVFWIGSWTKSSSKEGPPMKSHWVTQENHKIFYYD